MHDDEVKREWKWDRQRDRKREIGFKSVKKRGTVWPFQSLYISPVSGGMNDSSANILFSCSFFFVRSSAKLIKMNLIATRSIKQSFFTHKLND